MKKIYFIAVGAMLPILMGSCNDDYNVQDADQGRLLLRASVSTDITKSRALTDEESQKLSDECLIWISSEKGLVRKYDGISNVPTDGIWLAGGRYVAEAWAGDSVPASWDARYYKGVEPFNINGGGTTQVNLTCGIANTAVSVKYADAVDEALSDYTLTVGHSCGKLTWEGRDERRGYFMMNSRDKDLTYTLTGTKEDGSIYTLEGKIEAVKPATEYVLNIKYEGIDVENGGAYFTIVVDESTIDIADEIVIISAPKIVGLFDHDLAEPIYAEERNIERQGFYIAAAAPLTSVEVSAPAMDNLLGGSFNLITAPQDVIDDLYNRGVHMQLITDEEEGRYNMKVTFEKELLDNLTEGTYEITVKASIEVAQGDEAKPTVKSNTATMTIVVTNAKVSPEPVPANDPSIWATELTLTGRVMKDDVDKIGFNYRAKGETEWNYVDGVASRSYSKGDYYKVVLTGLQPGTTYEYTTVADDYVSTNIMEVTTESAAQLPNAGFENWQDGSAPFLIHGANEQMFWDSGNHGSSTMGKNVTLPETGIKHSGDRSIKLQSQFVGVGILGKFAAGNVFIGEYLATLGTNGVLGWGRPFTSRPGALKGYVKYEPAAIENTSKDAPEYVKGEMDRGIIYIALLDGDMSAQTEPDYAAHGYPVTVNTKTKHLFDKNGSNVIAYGEMIFREATAGDGMVEFTVNLDYKRTDVKPSYIVLTASASQGGDFFCGGNSVMYLDDLELQY
ncbi:MAG: DUF4493 domain-containing protein [Clostridiales bacterium]|nr:DUF4493 domain-containing protein [Clostridiales bacterium]